MTWKLQLERHPALILCAELLLIASTIGGLLWAVQTEQTALHLATRWADARIAAGQAAAQDRDQLIADYRAAYTWQDAEGHVFTYPVSRDSYYFLRLARNIIETGTPCPSSPSTGPCRDMQVNPFKGRPMNDARSPQPWAIAFVYKVLEATGEKPSLLYAGLLHNRLMLIVCGLLAYLLTRRLFPDVQRSSGLAAAVALILMPIVMKRCFGVDDDVWVLALLLGGALAAAEFLKAAVLGSWSWLALAAVIFTPLLLYAAWGGWLFLLAVQGSVAIIAFTFKLSRGRTRDSPGVSLYKIVLVGGSVLFIFLTVFLLHWIGNENFSKDAMTGTLPPPDAFAGVAELAPSNIHVIIVAFTWLVLIAAAIGLVHMVRRLWLWESDEFPATPLLVLVWLAGAALLLLVFRYERFLFLLAPPIAILAGLGISAVPAVMQRPTFRPVTTAGLSLLLTVGVTVHAITMARDNLPQLNSAWVSVLNYLSRVTPTNAILIATWDAGHWVTYWARRTTVVDGASLRNPRIHDVGRLLATDKAGSLDRLVNEAACGEQSDCHRPIYLLTSDGLLSEFSWMFSGFWQAKRAELVDQLAADKTPTGVSAGLLAAARKVKTPFERSLFATPDAQIWSTHWSPCRVASDGSYNCPLDVTSKNGWLVERLIIPAGHVYGARLVVRGHAGVAPILIKPSMMRLATQHRLFDVKLDTSTKNPGILLDTVQRRAFLGTPAVLRSLVARLVLLDGRYDQKRFKRVISASTVDGHRVTAWRVLQ